MSNVAGSLLSLLVLILFVRLALWPLIYVSRLARRARATFKRAKRARRTPAKRAPAKATSAKRAPAKATSAKRAPVRSPAKKTSAKRLDKSLSKGA